MKKISFILLLALIIGTIPALIVWYVLASQGESLKTGAAGIVDLDKVANTMGWTEQMRSNANQTQTQYQTEVDAHLRPLRDAFEQRQNEIAKANKMTPENLASVLKKVTPNELEKLGLTKPQIDELMRAATIYATESNAANAKMKQLLQAQQQALVLATYQAAEPALRRVAAANHRAVIMQRGGILLYVDPAADLTDKVIDDVQRSQVKLTLPAPPGLELHPLMPPTTQPH